MTWRKEPVEWPVDPAAAAIEPDRESRCTQFRRGEVWSPSRCDLPLDPLHGARPELACLPVTANLLEQNFVVAQQSSFPCVAVQPTTSWAYREGRRKARQNLFR